MRKHTTEFSKVILFVIAAVLLLVIVFSMVMIAVTRDLSPIDWILGGLFSLADVAVAFYYWKARCENLKKMEMEYKNENLPTDELEMKLEELKQEGSV